MKSPAAYYFLLLYCTVAFKVLLPLAGDAWSHAFNEVHHIAVVHAQYGSEHHQNEVAENTKKEQSSSTKNTLKVQDQVSSHVFNAPNDKLVSYQRITRHFPFLIPRNPLPVFIAKHAPPPKFA